MKAKNYSYYSDKIIIVAVLFLTVVSTIMIYSTWSITKVVYGDSTSLNILIRQAAFLFLAVLAYFFASKIPYTFYRKIAPFVWIAAVFLLIIVFGFPEVNESHSWIPLPGFNFQPSEFAKIAIILGVGRYYHRIEKKGTRITFSRGVLLPLCIVLIPVTLIFFQPDPGTALIILAFSFPMFLKSGLKFKYYLKYFVAFAGVIVFFIASFAVVNLVTNNALVDGTKRYQARMISRFDYKDPCDDFYGEGFQICNSLIAINSGGLTGKGVGESTQKYLYLPESHTDAIFAVTVEEFGFLRSILIFIAYGLIIVKILNYSKRTSDRFAIIVLTGIAFMYFFHIFINIGGILNMIPFTGVPLPFYSYGGTFLLICFGSLGIVQSIIISIRREEALNEL